MMHTISIALQEMLLASNIFHSVTQRDSWYESVHMLFDSQEGSATSSFLHAQEFFTTVLFVPQNVSDLAFFLAPSSACSCLAWLAMWTSHPLNTPVCLVFLSSVPHKSVGSI